MKEYPLMDALLFSVKVSFVLQSRGFVATTIDKKQV